MVAATDPKVCQYKLISSITFMIQYISNVDYGWMSSAAVPLIFKAFNKSILLALILSIIMHV